MCCLYQRQVQLCSGCRAVMCATWYGNPPDKLDHRDRLLRHRVLCAVHARRRQRDSDADRHLPSEAAALIRLSLSLKAAQRLETAQRDPVCSSLLRQKLAREERKGYAGRSLPHATLHFAHWKHSAWKARRSSAICNCQRGTCFRMRCSRCERRARRVPMCQDQA